MRKIKTILIATVLLGIYAISASADDNFLTGDSKLACEATMCLSTGTRPNECQPSIQKFFSIKMKKPGDTIKERLKFLKKCPSSNDSSEMQALVVAIANGAGQCDAASLNSELQQTFDDGNGGYLGIIIGNQLPGYCNIYLNNQYVQFGDSMPKYVGLPERGGLWVNASDYDLMLAAYNARVAQEDAAKALAQNNN